MQESSTCSDLAQYFRDQARWRELKGEEYPEDARNDQSAQALYLLAEYVDSGEVDGLARDLGEHLFEQFSLGGERAQRQVVRYGFGYSVGPTHHEEFLESLWVLCMEDAYELAANSDGDPTGTLLPVEIEAAEKDVYLPPDYWRRRSHQSEDELRAAIDEYAAGGEHDGDSD